jgi:Tfp pilus assembly protein PilF
MNPSLERVIKVGMSSMRMTAFGLCLSLLAGCNSFQELSREPMAYIEPGFGTRFYAGDEDSRRAWAHFVAGNYGLAERHYRSVVEVTPQNGAAWIGLAACYDRIGRFDLADRAYREAAILDGETHIFLNNLGYSQLLRGNPREARRLLERAYAMAPDDIVIRNNIAVLDSGQAYFKGLAP